MASNILLTGATGYIGGTILNNLLKANLPSKIIAVVRTDEQEQLISKLGVGIIRTNLQDEEAVSRDVFGNDIGIVISTTSSMDTSITLPLISALGKRKAKTGKPVFFIHTSGGSAFANNTGFPRDTIKDTEDVFSAVKQAEEKTPYPVRGADIAITEHALENDVASYIVVPSLVYGRGSGEGNKISVQLPTIIRTMISEKKAYKFSTSFTWQAAHVNDIALLYTSLAKLLLTADAAPPPSGKDGYIFASAHLLPWGEVTDRFGEVGFQRGLTSTKEAGVWDSVEQAAAKLGVTPSILSIAWDSSSNPIFDKGHQVGWKPEWTKERLMRSLDDEIQAVLDAGENAQTLAGMVNKNKEHLEGR